MRFLNVILLTGSMSLLVAQPQKPTTPAPAAQPAPVKKVIVPVEKMMEGMLVAVDAAKQSFTVKLKGTDYVFQAAGTTEILLNGNKVSVANLAKGSAIQVAYVKENGVRIAKTITQTVAVKTVPAAKAAAPVKAAPVAAQPVAAPAASAPVATQPAAAPAKAAPVATQPAPAPVAAQPAVTPAPKTVAPAPAAAQPAPATVKPAPAPAK